MRIPFNGCVRKGTGSVISSSAGKWKTKRILSFIFSIVMAVAAVAITPTVASASGIVTSGECGSDIVWTLYNDGTLVVSGAGTMEEPILPILAPWYSYASKVKKAIIEQGVTSIGRFAFSDCGNLVSIVIPKSVTEISWQVFHNSHNLKDIYYSGSEDAWNKISVGDLNTYLYQATIHYNSTGPENESDAPTLNLDKYVGKWYTYNDWKEEVGDLSISKQGNAYILNCNFYRLGGIDDAIISGRADGTATFAEQAGDISGTLSFDDDHITMTLDEVPNWYFDLSLTEYFNGATHIFRIKDGDETYENFQHTIKSHPDEDRDFTFNENEEVEQLVLSTSASQYNPRLAKFLAVMARSAYNEDLVKSNYEKLGISVSFNNSFDFANIEATYVVGKKQLVNDSYIVFITIRGSYGLSWVTDFAPGTALNFGGWHDGFEFCVNMLHKNIEDSFGGKIPTNARYVITGHSLGAAVGNLLATKLNEDGVPMNFVYAYNFACPDVANDWDWAWNHNGEHNNIFNIGCCQDPVTFVPGALADYFSWPWLFWGKYGQNVWFSENWNNLDKLMLDPSSHDMECYVDYMAKEKPFSEFRSYSEVFTSIIGNQLRTILGILCPVDVTVKNSNGDKLLSIIGDKVEYFCIDPKEVIVCFNGDEKCIVLPNTDDVIVELLATGDGTMTYTAAKVNMATREAIDSTRFSDVPLFAGKAFSSSVSGGETSSDATLFVTDAEGNIIERIQPDGESVVPVTSEPSVQPSGENEIITSTPDNKESNEIDSNSTGSNAWLIAVIAAAVAIIAVVILLTSKAKSIKNSKNEWR